MKAMRFDLKMYGTLVKMAMRSLMQYRADFWTSQKQVSALFLMEAVILLLGAAIVAEVAFVGLLWLLLVFLLVLLVLEAMVVSARLTGFVLAQRGNLRRLYGLGASAGTLIRAYSGQAERAAAWGMILTIVPSAALLWVLNKSEMYFLDLRPGVLAMNLGCAALLALSYILPVRLALKKAMRGIRAEER